MSERYSRLFTLPENLYAENAPVVISAGALLKDNQTGKVIAQLKLKNISSKSIKVAKVKILPMDSIGNPLGEDVESQYLDLNAQRDEEFGQKQAIQLPDISTRKMIVSVTEVFFSDNTSWVSGGEIWEALRSPVLRANDNATEQFRMDFGFDEYKPIYNISEYKGLWYCACGALNNKDEDVCLVCGNKLSVLKNVSWEELADKAEKRITEAYQRAQKEAELKKQKAQEEAALRKQKMQETKKKVKKYVSIVAALVIVVVPVTLFVTKYFIPNQKYKQAEALLESKDYSSARAIFQELGGYKDSENMVNKTYYDFALDLIDEGNYEYAITMFEKSNLYNDSEEKIAACMTLLASNYVSEGDLSNAIKLYDAIGDIGSANKNRYNYVLQNKNNDDLNTFEYLKILKAAEYEDSAAIYESLYKRTAEIFFNTDENDLTTSKGTISGNYGIYCHFQIKGVPGEYVNVKMKHETSEKANDGYSYYHEYGETEIYNNIPTGKFECFYLWRGDKPYHRITLYDLSTGEQLAQKVLHVTLK